VSILQTPVKTQMHLSEKEIRRLLAAADTPRQKALPEFFCGTGSRLGEVLRVRVTDLDLRSRTARVTGKYRKTRVVLLTQRAADALRDYIGDRRAGYVFQQEYPPATCSIYVQEKEWNAEWRDRGKQKNKYLCAVSKISGETAERALAEIMKTVPPGRKPKNGPPTPATLGKVVRQPGHEAGLPRAHSYMLRRTFATHPHENGADLTAIQKKLGHARIETTAKCANLSAFRLVDVFENCPPFGEFHAKGSRKHAESIHEEKRAEKLG
jgi:site-specific recombinase XerD